MNLEALNMSTEMQYNRYVFIRAVLGFYSFNYTVLAGASRADNFKTPPWKTFFFFRNLPAKTFLSSCHSTNIFIQLPTSQPLLALTTALRDDGEPLAENTPSAI